MQVFKVLKVFCTSCGNLTFFRFYIGGGLPAWEHLQSSCSGKMRGTWMLLAFNF